MPVVKSLISNSKTKNEKEDTRRAGGLSKILTVAINGRIMLCRNINPRIGLVNGATGVLQKISYVNNKANELFIKFDRINDVQKINKVSAVFNVGLDEQCIRHQFPVRMSFAATIHKCQGLTLKNVIVRTEEVFSSGQVFVACSRVQHGFGLHLADLFIEKIKVDIESLVQYNKHRSSIGLNTYPLPPSTEKMTTVIKTTTMPISKKTKSTNCNKSKFLKVKKIFINLFKKYILEVIVVKTKETNNANENTNNYHLKNTGNDCFLISCFNIISRMKELVDALKIYDQNNYENTIKILTNMFNKNIKDVTNVIELRQSIFEINDNEQHDASEVLNLILDKIPESVMNMYALTRLTTYTCSCNRQRQIKTLVLDLILSSLVLDVTIKCIKFNQFVSANLQPTTHRCSSCNNMVSITTDIQFSLENKYITLNF